jgi:hypothetical protein
MFDDRVPDPISRGGLSRDRPSEATHFERVEAARHAGDRGARGRRRAHPTTPGPTAIATPHDAPGLDDAAIPRRVGTHLDVRA